MGTTLDFQALHDQFRPRVLRYLTRLVGEAEAEDLTQAVMLKVSRGLDAFRGESSVSTWIYRIATNAARDRMRAASATALPQVDIESEEGQVPAELESPSVESSAIREEMSECIREYIARLPEAYRIPLVLSDIEGFTNEEIAAILHVTLGVVKIRLHRARTRLRAALQSGCDFYRRDDDELACDRKPVAVSVQRRR
jgi:RNA polymerase sigma-70 factor, ECF subfamily